MSLDMKEVLKATERTRFDRFVENAFPGWGLKRRQSRLQLAMSDAYAGASRSKRSMSEYNVPRTTQTEELEWARETLMTRSQDMHRNSAIARGIFSTSTTSVVGIGLKLNAKINDKIIGITREQAAVYEAELEAWFAAWFESCYCDLTHEQNGYSLQALAYRNYLIDGDCFALLPMVKREGTEFELCVQVIEAGRVSNPHWAMDDDKIKGGITVDENGRHTVTHITNKHPWSRNDKTVEWKPYQTFSSTGRRNVLHVYERLWPGQTRGEPLLAPVMEVLRMLSKYTETEIMATVLASMFTVFIKSDSPQNAFRPMEGVPEIKDNRSPATTGYKMAPGAMIKLANDEDVSFADPKRPNTGFDAFFEAMLKQIGMALGIPYEVLTKHFTASYSAARASMLEAWRTFYTRREWFARQFCQPIYEAFVEEAVLKGVINLPGFAAADALIKQAWCGSEWVGPGKGQIDELKEAQAADFRIKAGLSNRAIEVPALTGKDWEDVQQQLARENQVIAKLGTAPAVPGEEEVDENGDPIEKDEEGNPVKDDEGGDEEKGDEETGDSDKETPFPPKKGTKEKEAKK